MTAQVPGDELKWVRCCTNDDLVAMASQNGMVILSSCEKVSYISCVLYPLIRWNAVQPIHNSIR